MFTDIPTGENKPAVDTPVTQECDEFLKDGIYQSDGPRTPGSITTKEFTALLLSVFVG